jgi:hypothetical protein
MKKRGKPLLLSAACLLLVLLFIRAACHSTEPTYRGKPLAYWTKQFMGEPTPEQDQQSRTAIRALCTNQIPALVQALAYDDRPRQDKYRKYWSRARWVPAWIKMALWKLLPDRAGQRSETAQAALAALAPDIQSPLPGLARLVDSTNDMISYKAAWTISRFGTNGLPLLLQVAANPQHPQRRRALSALATMTYLGADAAPAIPVLATLSHDKDPIIAEEAIDLLGVYRLDGETAVPAITAALHHPNPRLRAKAIQALRAFRPHNPEAVASIQQALQDTAPSVREAATNFLVDILPAASTNVTRP